MSNNAVFTSRGQLLVHLSKTKNKEWPNYAETHADHEFKQTFNPDDPFDVDSEEDSVLDSEWRPPKQNKLNISSDEYDESDRPIYPAISKTEIKDLNIACEHSGVTLEMDVDVQSIDAMELEVYQELDLGISNAELKTALINEENETENETELNTNVNIIHVTDTDINDDFDNIKENEGSKRKRAKKGEVDTKKWKKNIRKNNRMRGLIYEQRLTNEDKEVEIKLGGQRKLKGRGCKTRCNTTSKRKCWSFGEADRTRIFKKFWNLNWDEKKAFVASMVDQTAVKQKTTITNSRRNHTMKYFLKNDEARIPVCKSMFLDTLGIGEKTLYGWLKAAEDGMPVEKQRQGRQRITAKASSAELFLLNLPKLPSHYCRSSSSKSYLEPVFTTFSDLYRVYKKHCSDNGIEIINRNSFTQIYNRLNLAIYKPKKDLCDICCGYDTNNVTENVYNEHILKKEAARNEKVLDKTRASEDPSIKVITLDLQSVLLSPKLNASSIYYKTKLTCHNYTVFDLTSRACSCYFWHEGEGELSANSFASCLSHYINDLLTHEPNIRELIIYSDGCTYQNRNVQLANALLKLSFKYSITIIQKFLEKGHTQMECDSVHSVIERKLKDRQIYTPYDYIDIITSARQNPEPYKVEELSHTFFHDFTSLKYYSSIRPGVKVGDPVVTSIRVLKYSPDGKIMYKLNHGDVEYEDMPRKSRQRVPTKDDTVNALYSSSLPITESKYKHLQELKLVIPPIYHTFYDNLLHE